MIYLEKVSKAIEATHINLHISTDYNTGWHDAGEDLQYSLSLSETACRQHIASWLGDDGMVLSEDRGYFDRIVAVNNLIEESNES